MASPLLLLGGTLLFGVLIGFVTGFSKEDRAGRDLVAALLGGGFLIQLFTFLASADIDLGSIALLGFGGGALIGMGIGLLLRSNIRGLLTRTEPS